jgi:L-lysine exporter family protein LysE/ArgO
MSAALHGFLLQMGMIVAIGAQNAFILKQGIKGEHVGAICLICAVSDAILICAGIGGFGALLTVVPWFGIALRLGGALFLILYGVRSAYAAAAGGAALQPTNNAAAGPLRTAVIACLVFTWLNPHVYLDTVVLIGSIAAQYPGRQIAFGMGAIAASVLFFFALGYGARLLRPVLARPAAWRMLDAGVAAIMWAIGGALLIGG